MGIKGKIAEVFASIQGEGLYLGEKQIFIRFFGCNIKCSYCDTKPDRFSEYEPDELFEEIKLYRDKYHSISFTGGEPLVQKDFLRDVLKLISKENFRNYLETNGTLPDELKEVIGYFDIVAMDIKLPSSTGLDSFWQAHRNFLKIASRKEVFLKAVICKATQETDLIYAIKLIKETNKSALLVLQPNSYEDNDFLREKIGRFRDLCLNEDITTCIIPQIQKLTWLR